MAKLIKTNGSSLVVKPRSVEFSIDEIEKLLNTTNIDIKEMLCGDFIITNKNSEVRNELASLLSDSIIYGDSLIAEDNELG